MCIYFSLPAQRLPNDLLNDEFFQTNPLPWRYFAVIGLIGLIFITSCHHERSAALCTALPGKPLFYRSKHGT